MFNPDFLLASIIVILIPGTGVLYTISIGFSKGWQASIIAAFGCTLGIVPHLIASIYGLSFILRMSSLVFTVIKIVGVIYLVYLAWQIWHDSESIDTEMSKADYSFRGIVMKGILLNILNPKLTLFFFAFLPVFISEQNTMATVGLLKLGLVFMLLTLIVFSMYGAFASKVQDFFRNSTQVALGIKRLFSALFVGLAIKLALLES